MTLSDLYLRLGEAACGELLRSMSLGRLRSFQLFDRIKTRLHVTKLNTETLKKAGPRTFQRIQEGDTDLALELAQAVLVSHLEMIEDVLNFLGIPHQSGFFEKDLDPKPYLTDGWQKRVYEHFAGKYPASLLGFYVNHLAIEVLEGAEFVAP